MLSRFKETLTGYYPNTMNADLHDAFEIYFFTRQPARSFYDAYTLLFLIMYRLRLYLFKNQLFVNERIVEYPTVLQWIRPGESVLDIGCVSSRLPIQLASLGHQVTAIDVRPYGYQHPNLVFVQADIFEWTPGRRFEVITAVSTIEHFGVGMFGDRVVQNADKAAIRHMREWLAPGGRLIVSVPYGKYQLTENQRIYDREHLEALFSDFKVIHERYFKRTEDHWHPCSSDDLVDVGSTRKLVNGVAILCLGLRNSEGA